jgi:ketosteroid isomerase-like protein
MNNKTNNFINNILPIFIVLIIIGCSDKRAETKPIIDAEAEKEIIKSTLNKMWTAIENEDIEAYASYVHPDFSQFGEYDSILEIGKELDVEGVTNWIKTSKNIHTEMIDPIVTIRDNVAWITYYWSDNGTTDGVPFASQGKSTRIFVKEKGKWLCIHGHYTLLPPPN